MIERNIDEHNGAFRVRIQVDGRRVAASFATLELARRFRDGAFANLAEGRIVLDAQGVTVAQAARAWLPTRKLLSSYPNDRSRWARHVEGSALAELPVANVTRRDVRAFARTLTGAWSSRRNVLTLVRQFFAAQVDDERIASNPADGVTAERDDAASSAHEEYERAKVEREIVAALRDALTWMGQRTDDTEERRRIIAAGWAALEGR